MNIPERADLCRLAVNIQNCVAIAEHLTQEHEVHECCYIIMTSVAHALYPESDQVTDGNTVRNENEDFLRASFPQRAWQTLEWLMVNVSVKHADDIARIHVSPFKFSSPPYSMSMTEWYEKRIEESETEMSEMPDDPIDRPYTPQRPFTPETLDATERREMGEVSEMSDDPIDRPYMPRRL